MCFLSAAVGHRMMDHEGNEELGIKGTRKENNEKYHMEELDLLKRIQGSCFNKVNRKAEVTGVTQSSS